MFAVQLTRWKSGLSTLYHVFYSSHKQGLANNGGRIKHLRKNHWFIKMILLQNHL